MEIFISYNPVEPTAADPDMSTADVEKIAEDAKQMILECVRKERNRLLLESDWVNGEDSPLSAEKKSLWYKYRQDLRDLPDSLSFESSFVFSSKDFPSPPA